ncbi:hypothetical protein EVG20_g3188 [Dentipellis fragilis]|uniref:Uncharacterized protein n=1 Tax=Dentipellis fragilis TaxID=205917 RepID=A0A4Y9Z5E0_9AGAM|nr:hypothetical protein EVG20_g3188 [Dentipellis fragilis]
MSTSSTPSPTLSCTSLSRSPSPSPPRTPPNLHQNTIDPAAQWLVQKYGGTSVGKFVDKIAGEIVPCVLFSIHSFPILSYPIPEPATDWTAARTSTSTSSRSSAPRAPGRPKPSARRTCSCAPPPRRPLPIPPRPTLPRASPPSTSAPAGRSSAAPQAPPPPQQLGYLPPQHAPPSASWDGHLAPSVSRETLARSRSDVSRPHPPERPLSEFAREFYEAGAAVPGQADTEGAGEGSSRPRYAPPPGEPPVRRPRSASANPGAGTSASASASAGADEDGRPTRTPVPGHPLLRDGQVLVYPTGHECTKCRNTGYKNFDPGHPCRTCWSRFGRPFTGALQYLPWGSSSASSNSRGAKQTYQRPLPSFTPPHLASTSSVSVPSSSGYPGNNAHRRVVSQPMRTPGMTAPPSPQRAQVLGWGQRPPPGALVLQPGDARLGGRLCWNCRGSGVVTMFIFEEQCDVCRGVGRTFP